jgi:ribosomal protein S18 acetylase RimI-like enzyme
MTVDLIVFKTKTATEKQICSHLEECSDSFIPPLTERVNIAEYAKKIFAKAVTFEAWSDPLLAGMIAVYFNDSNHSAFITNVSVMKQFMKLGIASELLKTCIKYVRQRKCTQITLEVNNRNNSAINFYEKAGFIKQGAKDDLLIMGLEIN